MRTPTSLVAISLPILTADMKNFKFSSAVSGVTYTFNFSWNGTAWFGWANMPDGSIRPFGVYPNATNWTGFPDVGLLFASALSSIGLNDWGKVSMYMLVW